MNLSDINPYHESIQQKITELQEQHNSGFVDEVFIAYRHSSGKYMFTTSTSNIIEAAGALTYLIHDMLNPCAAQRLEKDSEKD